MTDFVYFKELRIYDSRPSWSLEDSIRNTASLGGIHDFSFLSTIADDFSSGSLSDWETPGEGTWSIDSERLKGVGGGSSRWYRLYHSVDVPLSFVARFTKQGDTGAFVFAGGNYAVTWSATKTSIVTLDSNGSPTKLAEADVVLGDDSEIVVAARYQQMTDFDVVDWMSAAVYICGRCVVGASHYMQGETYGDEVGFAVWESDTAYFDDFEISELHRLVEWTSVDPDELVASGMNRAIATTPLFYFCRYDGTLRAWLPGNRDADWVPPSAACRQITVAQRKEYFTPAHVRMVGAYHEAGSWNQDMAEKQGRYTFALVQDPNLVTIDEIRAGAEKQHNSLVERGRPWSITLPGNPLTEPQDRVTLDSEDVRVLAVQFVVERRGKGDKGAPVFTAAMQGVDYIEE